MVVVSIIVIMVQGGICCSPSLASVTAFITTAAVSPAGRGETLACAFAQAKPLR